MLRGRPTEMLTESPKYTALLGGMSPRVLRGGGETLFHEVRACVNNRAPEGVFSVCVCVVFYFFLPAIAPHREIFH